MARIGLLALALLSQGCAAYMSRHHWNENVRCGGTTTYFAGTVDDCVLIGEGIAAPFQEDFEWIETAVVPLCLIDLPLSLVADVLWVPSDFMFQRASRRRAEEREQTAE